MYYESLEFSFNYAFSVTLTPFKSSTTRALTRTEEKETFVCLMRQCQQVPATCMTYMTYRIRVLLL